MISFDNSAIRDYCFHNLEANLNAAASFAYDADANTITVTDESTVTSPDTFKILHVDIYDRFGGKRYAAIKNAGAAVVVHLGAVSKALAAINVTAGGTGYTSDPTVTFTGGGGSGAAAHVIRTGGVITGIVVTNYGSGYTSVPTIGFTGGAGSGATATAVVSTAPDQPAMNPSRSFALAITVVTAKGAAKDGTAFKIANTYDAGEVTMEQ